MSDDRLAHFPGLRRPTAVIGWSALLYAIATLPLAAMNLDKSWRHPLEGLTAWMILWLVLAVPLTGVVTVLAARMDRALSGVRHPMRAAWAGVALGWLLVAHWAVHLLWSPAYLLFALTENHRREAHLVGFVAALLAWAFAAGGLWIARTTHRRLRDRDWSSATADEGARRFPRIPTPWLGAIAYGLALFPISAILGGVAVDEGEPVVIAFMWAFVGLIAAGAGAAWGSWAYAGAPHGREPTRGGPRFFELLGTAWTAHWLPFYAIAVVPFWGDWHHGEQLAASVVAAFALVLGVAGWSYGRAARLVAAA